ncbi:MAG: DNA repair protein RecO [Actinomycetota bacterium]|nr:DNA repair protein RecO [Actinomycetota bacterium]
MPSYKAKALVLRVYKLGEYDKIVKMYSRSRGLINGVAKGARKPGGRFGGRLELFNLVDLEMYSGHSLDIIAQAEIIDSFKLISSDFYRFVFCELIAKIVLKTQTDISEHCPQLFKLIYICFREINAAETEDIAALKKIMCFFIGRFLSITGYSPLLDSCCRCNAKLDPGPGALSNRKVALSYRLGGVLCDKCSSGFEGGSSMGAKSFRFLSSIYQSKIEDIRDMEVDGSAIKQVYKFLENYIIYHTDCNLDSFKYLKKIGA